MKNFAQRNYSESVKSAPIPIVVKSLSIALPCDQNRCGSPTLLLPPKVNSYQPTSVKVRSWNYRSRVLQPIFDQSYSELYLNPLHCYSDPFIDHENDLSCNLPSTQECEKASVTTKYLETRRDSLIDNEIPSSTGDDDVSLYNRNCTSYKHENSIKWRWGVGDFGDYISRTTNLSRDTLVSAPSCCSNQSLLTTLQSNSDTCACPTTTALTDSAKANYDDDDDDDDDDKTGFASLLNLLEQQNYTIACDPKTRTLSCDDVENSVSDAFAQDLVSVTNSSMKGCSCASPNMSDTEFFNALAQNYTEMARKFPTLTNQKIQAGIPSKFRGSVWISMTGARDSKLQATFDKLYTQPSPCDHLIAKDIGRSFPVVEMFRDPNGEGQKKLNNVLKCYSLYDSQIGYCQGLGFLAGSLLMQMDERDAFCVLVRITPMRCVACTHVQKCDAYLGRIMEDYNLRSCFVPGLAGLHMRIFQLESLVEIHLPRLSAHFKMNDIEGSYLSQWFMSLFAVTCPLTLLFRIYDVLLAEGAGKTIMRVALSLLKKNEEKLLQTEEFEGIMQMLLSRSLWEAYGSTEESGDEFMKDLQSFSVHVRPQVLSALEIAYREEQSLNNTSKSDKCIPSSSRDRSKYRLSGWLNWPSSVRMGSRHSSTSCTNVPQFKAMLISESSANRTY